MAKQPVTMRGRQLGLELRRLRNTLKLSADEVATRLGWSQSKVTRIENGVSPVTRPDLLRLLDLYGVTEEASRTQFTRLGRAARERGWWVDYRDTITNMLPSYMALEADAAELLQWSWAIVPGLLQTPEYARALFSSDLEPRTEESTDRLVEARVARQERLRDGEVNLWAILDESLLHRAIGGTEVMRGQLSRLLNSGNRVTLQVMRSTVTWHPGLNGAFTIMLFPEVSHPPFAWSESAAGDMSIEQAADVKRHTRTFDHLRAIAESPVHSMELIASVRDKL
ncbi:helix-turn-helix domain-containing protein [Actinoplanes sp. NPDC051859]|uniref:helix-turn-helix domain-containing protein n=1 Tax=Actinoplanes sp. NPDC051859 TaxID=3363909 RepID=UPI0037B3D105